MFSRSIVLLSQLVLSSVASSSHSQDLLKKVLDPATSVPEVVSIANEIVPLLSSDQVTVGDKYHLLRSLASRKVRHEGVLQKCIWDILKADPAALASPRVVEGEGARVLEMDESSPVAMTAATFRLFSELEFRQDYQLVALGLGRCVEIAPLLSLRSAADIYAGLAALNVQHFSLTSVALRESNITENYTVKEFYDSAAPEGDALAMQPNLIDVLCGELEERLRLLSPEPPSRDAPSLPSSALATSPTGDRPLLDADQRAVLLIASSMKRIGLQRADALTALEGVLRRMAPLPLDALVFLMGELLAVQLRVVDVLEHAGSDRELDDTKAAITLFLAHRMMAQPNLRRALRHSPDSVIRLRRLFETSLILQERATRLWDVVRCVKVAHKHIAPKPKDGVVRTSSLFKPKYAVKTQRVTCDLSEAERFVPPQFKTWRSPAHSPRGGHSQAKAKKQPRVIAFGNQRITKDYMKKKRRKYARHV